MINNASSPDLSVVSSVVSTSPAHWRYVNEGGATIVFAYTGPPDPQFSETVLRLRKCPLDSEPGRRIDPENEPDDPSIAFQHKVTSKLVSPTLLPQLSVVFLDREWLVNLRGLAQSARPISRRIKDDIDVNRCKGVLATDLVGAGQGGLAIELKPKWGFLPNTSFLSPETRQNKTLHCRYCMHAQLKEAVGEPFARGYCPLDLFSPNPQRIYKAATSLWNSWIENNASINNLRIFIDGEIVKPTPATHSRLAKYLGLHQPTDSELSSAFINYLTRTLIASPALERLQHLQRILDPLDIEGLSWLWRDHYGGNLFDGIEAIDPALIDWQSFIGEFSKNAGSKLTCLDGIEEEQVRFYVMSYLLSASFKDCSVIIRCPHEPEDEAELFIIDLDPKTTRSLRKWFYLDNKIATFCRDAVPCVDDHTL